MPFLKSILFLLLALCAFAEPGVFENTSVIKTADLSEAVIKVTLRIQVHVIEGSPKEYYVAIPKSEAEHMAVILPSSSNKLAISVKKAEIQDR